MRQSTFTEPTIYPKNPEPEDMAKEWRVWFRFFHAGKWKQIVRKGDLNSHTKFKERVRIAEAMKEELIRRLAKGWNPVTNTYPQKTSKELELERLQNLTLSDALDFAKSKKERDWSHKTKQDYGSAIKYLKVAAMELYPEKAIKEYRRTDFKLLLEEVANKRKLSGKGYNKYREYLSSLVAELVEWDIMETNPIRDIKTRPTEKTFAHKPPTADQRLLIANIIRRDHRDYFRFIAVVYGCAIRPKEITRIQIKHLHKMEGMFKLPPSVTKTNTEREVAIPNWVMDLLSELHLHRYDPDDYIFSGKGHMFRPGKNQMSPNVPSYRWREIVKKKLKLSVNQYSLKKLSGDDMVKLQRLEGANNLLGLAQMQMGHENQSMTSVYTQQDKEIMKHLIREKMPKL